MSGIEPVIGAIALVSTVSKSFSYYSIDTDTNYTKKEFAAH